MSEPDWKTRAEAAEKTVEVLVRRVRDLQNGRAKSAIQRQMERARERETKNRERRAMSEMRAAELAKYSETLEVEVKERTKEIQTILDNVTFGFLIIDRSLTVQSGFTSSCEEILGKPLEAGANLAEVLECDADHALMLSLAFEEVFEGFMPDELTLAQVPSRFTPGDRIVRLEARCIRDDAGEITSVLCTLSDIQALEKAKEDGETARSLLGILLRREAFISFIQDAKSLLANARSACQEGRGDFVRRAAHTLKGNSASFGLGALASLVHDIEEGATIGVEEIDQMEAALSGFLESNANVLGIHYDEQPGVHYSLDEEQVAMLELVQEDLRHPKLHELLVQLHLRPMGDLVGPVVPYVLRVAERLEKPLMFDFVGEDLRVDAGQMGPIASCLSHLLRNAVDHGIESGKDRAGKPAKGTLALSVLDVGEGWQIVVSDDGKGIDTETLAARAGELGLLTASELMSMSDEDKLRLVFLDGLSSAKSTTDLSGRGVGMPAVLEAVESVGGTVEITSVRGKGSSFEIHIPKRPAKSRAAA